jgi:hypothetical protein
MKNEKDNRIYKIIIGALALILIWLGSYAYRANQENIEVTTALTNERDEISLELANINADYQLEIEKGTELSMELSAATDRIARLRDSVNALEPNVALLARLRKELLKIKDEREVLKARIFVLERENEKIARAKDSTLQALNEEMIASIQKSEQIEALNENMAKAATLIPANFNAKGLIIRSSGKQIENDRARRVDDVQVCFTLPQNPVAEKGLQSFFLQVISPEGNILGSKESTQLGNQTLVYSKKINMNYQGKELDVCELIQANEDAIVAGDYVINLYNAQLRIANSTLKLR